MKQKIIPTLGFQRSIAQDAFEYYSNNFPNTSIIKSTPLTVSAILMGVEFYGINGLNAKCSDAISFMSVFETKEKLQMVWNELSTDATVLMTLNHYPWSEYYGWLRDKFGVSWQLYLGKLHQVNYQHVVPTLMFCGPNQGKCKQAINFYKTLFNDFHGQGILEYPEGEMKGQVMHAQFKINGFTLAAMDSGTLQNFTFNESTSLAILCENQDEIDYYWKKICARGHEGKCGWCKDEYGISWQILPWNLSQLLDTTKNAREEFIKMKKIDVLKLNP